MKKINVELVSSWKIMKPNVCDVCGEKAEYTLRAFSLWRGIRYADLCEKHRLDWINGSLSL